MAAVGERPAELAVGVAPGMPFGRWLHDGHPLGWPTPDDLCYHASTLFPPVRPRGWFELRVLDALPAPLRTAAAVVVAAAAVPSVAVELLDRVPDTNGWWLDAAHYGLAHPSLARAAALLLRVAAAAAPEVTARPARAAAVARLRDEVEARGVDPEAHLVIRRS